MELADIENDQYLKPVIDDDALILSLDELDLDGPAARATQTQGVSQGATQQSPSELNASLVEELETVKSQFANYRLAVEQTLDKRWGDDATTSSTSQRPKDPSQYYWESYAANGNEAPTVNLRAGLTRITRHPRNHAQRHHTDRRIP